MNSKIIFLSLISIFIFGCTQDKIIQMSSESLTENELDICNDQKCPEITINYLQADGANDVSEKINKKINDFIIGSLMFEEGTFENVESIEDAASNFARIYFEDKERFPDMAADYTADITVSEIFISPTLISLEMAQYLYTGGAHGYGNTSFLNIDPKTGEELSMEKLIKDKAKFTSLAEDVFRKQQNIKKSQSINDLGFWFEGDSFYLPETVGFTTDTLIFIYNQYDIASYADGPIELKIPLSNAKPYLNKNVFNNPNL